MFTDISTYDKRISTLKSIDGYDTNPEYRARVEDLSKEKANLCMKAILEAGELYDAGSIDEKYYYESTDKLIGLYEETLRDGVSWYQESVSAKLYATAINELASLGLMGAKMINGLMLTKTGKAYVRERLSKYTISNEDAIDARRFKSATYTIEEAEKKYHIHFKYASKWESSGLQTYCKVYFYEDKPVMVIAYNREKLDHVVNSKMNIETILIDSNLRKHEDYYTAYMCADLQMMHPSIKRTLDTLKTQWKHASNYIDKEIDKDISESVDDSLLDTKIKYIEEACDFHYIGKHDAEVYKKYLQSKLQK